MPVFPSLDRLKKLLFLMSFLLSSRWAVAAKCGQELSKDVIASKHSRALGLYFDDVYKSSYGASSQLLRDLFTFLEIGDRHTQDPSAVLQTVLSHLYQTPSFIDRYYPNADSESRALFESTLYTLDARLHVLERYLLANPLKGKDAPKLFAALTLALLSDFRIHKKFMRFSDSYLFDQLEKAQKNYFVQEAKENNKVVNLSWQSEDDTPMLFERDDGDWNRFSEAPPNTYDIFDDLVVFRHENRSMVEKKMNEINVERFAQIEKKAIFDEFKDLEILKDYHFYVLHKSKENQMILLKVYERGIVFVMDVMTNSDGFFTKENVSPALTSKFFYNLRDLLNGSLNERFGSEFTNLFKDQMEVHVVELHEFIRQIALPNDLFPARSALIALNECFALYGLAPVSIK